MNYYFPIYQVGMVKKGYTAVIADKKEQQRQSGKENYFIF